MDIRYGDSISMHQLLESIDQLDPEAIVYTWNTSSSLSPSSSLVLMEDEEYAPSGSSYLLEVHLIKDVITVWSEWRDGRAPSLDEKCAAVAHYATHDAYIPTDKAG
ncbi:hypothetical protein OG292_23550 [Streptomyces sp. NBC_01511]|uniref:hypothetical protein n=1 Tax=Streptomyces sp. NBC_01511 TaxID=2903889 RepID=UPI0038683EB9